MLTEKLDYPWQIWELAAAVSLGRKQLERRFKAATGYSPLQYLQTLRMQKARELLVTTLAPIAEVAAQVGLFDPRYFRQVFRQQHQMSPRAWRERYREATLPLA